ncbi:MAG: cation diffusion facilitator family transporter [Bacteroidales bacterium]|nr:cation diffusion facilitator family transporter [Candidatus Latescibacterota bacterium]
MSGQSHNNHSHDLGEARKITWYGMGVNAALIILKLGGGTIGRSRALLADGVHSISDFISDIVVLIGLHFFGKEKDESHPYGHGKIETLTSIGVGLLLLFAAYKIGYGATISIYRHETNIPGGFTIIIAALSVISKEILYQATIRTGRKIGSETMIANAWHHRSDALSSIVTLVGISLAVYVPKFAILDSFAALLVSFFIAKVAFDILKGSVRKIVDTSPSREFIDGVVETTSAVEGVEECHDVMARYYADKIRMEIHIEVDPEMTVSRSHLIIDNVVARITSQYPKVEKILVHVDPHRPGENSGKNDFPGDDIEIQDKID